VIGVTSDRWVSCLWILVVESSFPLASGSTSRQVMLLCPEPMPITNRFAMFPELNSSKIMWAQNRGAIRDFEIRGAECVSQAVPNQIRADASLILVCDFEVR
jgi:hypothetical protein